MKIFLLFLLFFTNMFATSFEKSYIDLNTALDKIAPHLTTESKITLYYLVLATHDKMQSHSSILKLKKHTLQTLSNLHEVDTNKLKTEEIEKIRELYTNMTTTTPSVKKAQIQTVYKDRVVYKEKSVKKISSFVKLVTILLSLIIGFILGGFVFYRYLSLHSDRHLDEIKEFQEHNNILQKSQKRTTKTTAEKLQTKESPKCKELERTNSSLSKENSTMEESIKKLEAKLHSLESSLTQETQTLQTELTQQNEYVESLKHELAKHETNSGTITF